MIITANIVKLVLDKTFWVNYIVMYITIIMKHTLPPLPYAYNALEPYIDARTMEIHHTKHHQAYVDNLNKVLDKYPQFADEKLESLMEKLESLDMNDTDRKMLRNNGGGHLNHSFFWQIMSPAKSVDQALIADIESEFGAVGDFKKLFTETATKHFGSGWAWLVKDGGKLAIYSLPNQDSPYLSGHTPLIGLDLWEHAYYLKYQNRRPQYIENWWKVLKLL